MKTFKIKDNDISDGYHTFDELYEHRVLLFINLCLKDPGLCTFKKDFENWFCLYMETSAGQISYHCHNKYLTLIEGKIPEDPDYIWDGHTSDAVINRLTQNAT